MADGPQAAPVRLEDLSDQDLIDKAAELKRELGEAAAIEAYHNWLTPIREEAFERRAAAMQGAANLAPFVQAMTALHGPSVRVFRCTLSWLAALAVVRYGEALYHWPAAWAAEDVLRAHQWVTGERPAKQVTYIVAEEPTVPDGPPGDETSSTNPEG